MEHQDFLHTIMKAYPDTETAPRDPQNSHLGWKEQLCRVRGYRSKIVVGCLISVSVILWIISPRSCIPANQSDPVDRILRMAPLIGIIIVRACQNIHAHAVEKMATMTSQSGFEHFIKTIYII